MTYSLLSGVRVLELSLLAPDMLGMHLADLGADVIKIEQPPRGDYVREIRARRGGVAMRLDLDGCVAISTGDGERSR